MTEFPRGWTLTGAGSITIPATPGVVHVLDSLFARLWTGSAAPPAVFATNIDIQSPAGTSLLSSVIGNMIVPAATTVIDDLSFSSLDKAGAPGAALVVLFTVAPIANVGQFLLIQGHDI